ncbi:hypothetical protein BDQ17DRAFT_1285765 [Cyathus striatus]|nr:hypothetical protein BDQ17DRAFT_1285765 [Cyathus striatus]
MLTFYDIPSKVPGQAWSPTNWKVRFVLNYKKLEYKTEWIEYPDIEAFCKEHGIPPTASKPDGTGYNTLPAIHDDKTGIYMADTFPIAQYLDKTYPDTLAVVPAGTEAIVKELIDTNFPKLHPLIMFAFYEMTQITNPVSGEYFERTRSGFFGKPVKDIVPTGEAKLQTLELIKNSLGEINALYKGKYIMGDNPTLPDFVFAATFLGVKILLGEESDVWMEVAKFQGGKWAGLLDDLKAYQGVF